LNQSVAETNLETEVVKAKNRLNSKLKGFSNRFFGELTSQLSELIDTLFEPLRNGLNAQNQIRGYQKQLRDQIQSGNDLVGQFQPGGGGVANTGSVAGSAQKSGLYTAPQSNNGGSAEYHIDTKFSRTLSLDQIVAMLDQLAAGYRQQGRQMMFSNSAVNGEVYDETANIEEKKKLAQRAMEAHSHSVSENYQSLDYYIPNRGEGLHSSSVENAEMLIPTLPGMNLEYGSGGRYGNYVAGVVNGEVVFKQGHGDDSRPLPQNRTVSSQPTQSAANTTSQPTPQPTPQSSGGINAATLREAIIEKESSGRHDIVNRHSGALGLYQVMPDNLPRWSQQVVGREVSKDEFLSNPQLQTQIVTGIMQDMLDTAQAATSDPREQVRRVASEWYSGRQERFDNPNPQYTDGQEYPSIRAYTNDIADKYERLTVSGGSPAQATTQNGTRIDPSMVQSGNNLVRAGVDNAIAATEAQLAALDQQAAIRLRQTIDQIKRTQRDGIEELNDTAIAEQRKLEDLQVQGEPETPELNYQIQIRDINRQEQDATRDLSRTIREIKEGLEILEATRQEILELGKTNPQVLELIPGLEQSIATSQSRLAELQSVYDNYAEAFGANRRKITEEFVRAEENRQFAFRSTRRSIDSQSSDALAQDYTLRGDGRRAIGVNETERVTATNFDVDSRIRDLEEQLRTKTVTQDEFDNAKRALEEYRRLALDNISRSSENDRDNFDITQGEALANSRIDLFQGQADSLAARGFTRQSRDIQREIAIEQQNLSFSSQLAELERMADSGAYAAETIDQLRQNLTDLNAIKLEDINTEFDTGSQIFKTFQDTAKNSLASLITGAESAQQVLEGFFNSLATSLANMASDFLLSEIFGLLGGIGGRGKGAETENKGFLGDALGVGVGVGMSLFTAASGGEVPKMNMSGLRDRPDSIGRALRKEGSNSVLAALTPGELVLSVEKAKKFNELGMGEVLNFKNGGMVGAASPRFSPTMRGGDINIPVNISGEGSNSGGLDIGRIREAVRTSVVEELNYQARPRGINYKG
jgi:hypothetical protein